METMKIMIGYDGSPHAASLLADLNRAGLPRKVEAMVLSVSEEWMPAPASLGGVVTSFPKLESEAEDEALKLARSAKAVLKTLFPDWQVHAEAVTGSPGNMLIWKSDEWKPDLIVVGSQGRTALGRFFFGSVSQKVLHHADCSVRIARAGSKDPTAPVRLIVGVDGLPDSDAAVRAITTRHWPKGSEVCVVSGMWVPPPVASEQMAIEVEKWIAGEKTRTAEAVEAAVKQLQGIRLTTSSVVKEEDPKGLLCAEAESRDADCIFVGATGMGGSRRRSSAASPPPLRCALIVRSKSFANRCGSPDGRIHPYSEKEVGTQVAPDESTVTVSRLAARLTNARRGAARPIVSPQAAA